MTEETKLASPGARPYPMELASRMTDQDAHIQLPERNMNDKPANSSTMSSKDSQICGAAATTCLVSGVGVLAVVIILVVVAILIHKRWRTKTSGTLWYIGNLSCVKPRDCTDVINLKCLGRQDHDVTHRTVNCCVINNRHSQPNAYIATNLNDCDSPADDVSKQKPNEDMQQEYCYIDIDQMDRDRLPSVTPSTIYEDIECAHYVTTPNRFCQRDTMFDNKDVIEVMENDIYDRSEDENDCGVEIVENDMYDSYNNADCGSRPMSESFPENHVYEEVGPGTKLDITKK